MKGVYLFLNCTLFFSSFKKIYMLEYGNQKEENINNDICLTLT